MTANQETATTATVGQLALVRSRRGGNATTLGVVARGLSAYALLCRELTVVQVQTGLGLDPDRPIRRVELPNLLALSFLIEDARHLEAGPSLSYDPNRQVLGIALLDLQLPQSAASSD
jgi:hypothetical protein